MAEINLAQLGYEHYYQMLSDTIRMDAYRKAIYKNVKPGDIVVDLGSGTGILSIWAVKAGAAKVYAIEKTGAINLAKKIARVNDCLDKIEFINENSMQVNLPEKADILISETLGSFAIDENTLEFTNDARERFLKEDAILIPQSIDLFIAPMEDIETYNKIDFWRKIPDINFSPAFDLFSKKIMVESVRAQGFLAPVTKIGSIDLTRPIEKNFTARVYMQMKKAGQLHGVAGWFHTRLCAGVEIDTSPESPLTHWKQAFFPFQDPIDVIEGDVLDWSITIGSKEQYSDDSRISYEYRCTQLKDEPEYTLQKQTLTQKKTGRNDPCPCGSGKKYKRCCSH
ncbi:MAG: 50S ribosomal protein L11 methyltransferase [Gammaproteobacteria bacterium]|nr:50S ribosomal protein L11 methyltransferase [Gammaproteobacteria bacterium]